MGIVAKFCDRLADEHPAYAQAVLDRKIGKLSQLFEDGERASCGCVVGTVALAAGFTPRPDCDWDAQGRWVFDVLGERLGWDPSWIDDVSLRVYYIALRLSIGPAWRHSTGFAPWIEQPGTTLQTERLTVHLIRRRIAVRLALHTLALDGAR